MGTGVQRSHHLSGVWCWGTQAGPRMPLLLCRRSARAYTVQHPQRTTHGPQAQASLQGGTSVPPKVVSTASSLPLHSARLPSGCGALSPVLRCMSVPGGHAAVVVSVARMPREGASWGSPVPVVLPHPIGGRAVCPQTEHSREDLAQHGWPGTVVGQVTRLCQEDHVPYATAKVGCGARLGGEPHRTSGWQRPLLRLSPVLQGTRA